MDSIQVLQLAKETGGHTNFKMIESRLCWDRKRIDHVLEGLLKNERVWVDTQSEADVEYWFPLLFLKQNKSEQQNDPTNCTNRKNIQDEDC